MFGNGQVISSYTLKWMIITSCFFNSLRPGDAYMHQYNISTLVQIMACRLSATSQYLNQCWYIVNKTLGNKIQWNFNQNSNIFIKKMHLKMSSGKWHLFCLCLNVLIKEVPVGDATRASLAASLVELAGIFTWRPLSHFWWEPPLFALLNKKVYEGKLALMRPWRNRMFAEDMSSDSTAD